MKIALTSRHMEITDLMRRYVTDKGERLKRYCDQMLRLEVILDLERDNRYSVEMIASVPRGNVIVCHAIDQTATAAVDSVLDKMERQLTRFKERSGRERGRSTRRTLVGRFQPEPEDVPGKKELEQ